MNDENDVQISKTTFWVAACISFGPLLVSFIFAIVGLLHTFPIYPVLVVFSVILVVPWFMFVIYMVYDRLREKYKAISERGEDHDG